MILLSSDWDLLPWNAVGDVQAQWEALPTFIVIELLMIALSLAGLIHSISCNRLWLWIASTLCGVANDVFFMVLPVGGEFWQSQALIMLTPRLPLYIVALYCNLMYISTSAATSFKLPAVGEAAASGLLACLFYAAYDILGATYLWWTWHTTDAAISQRLYGAPVGSTMWILTYCSIQCLLFRWCTCKKMWSNFLSLCVTCIATTPLFMQTMGIFQVLSMDTLGQPGVRTLSLAVCIYTVIVLYCTFTQSNPTVTFKQITIGGASCAGERPGNRIPSWSKYLLWFTLMMYYCGLTAVAVHGDPSTQVSVGIHQQYRGKCDGVEQVSDLMGFTMDPVVCDSHLPTNEWTVCNHTDPLKYDGQWYSVCGRTSGDFEMRKNVVLAIAAVGCAVYTCAFLILGNNNNNDDDDNNNSKKRK